MSKHETKQEKGNNFVQNSYPQPTFMSLVNVADRSDWLSGTNNKSVVTKSCVHSTVTNMAPGGSMVNGTVTVNGDLKRNLVPNAENKTNGKKHKVSIFYQIFLCTFIYLFYSYSNGCLACQSICARWITVVRHPFNLLVFKFEYNLLNQCYVIFY